MSTLLPLPERASDVSAEQVRHLVTHFYDQVHADPQLGPVFARHVRDWPAHLAQMSAFWDGLLRGQPGFTGAPLARHLAIDGLQWALFERWLALFQVSAGACLPPAVAAMATERAGRIASHFWSHYQRRQVELAIRAD